MSAPLCRVGTIAWLSTTASRLRLVLFQYRGRVMLTRSQRYPAIAIIVVGGLIILSIVWCCARCLCFGMSCCCSCFQCLKCCGNCCGCCDPPGGRRHKYLDEPYIPPHHDQGQGYRPEPPMPSSYATPSYATGITSKPEPAAQYATFDSGPKKDADALPAMPSWNDSDSKKVLLEDDPVELEQMKKPADNNGALASPADPTRATSPGPASPGYIPPGSQPGPNGYMAAGRSETDPYGTDSTYGVNGQYNNPYGSQNNHDPYNQSQSSMDQGYGMAGAMAGQRTRTPYQDYNNTGYRGTPVGNDYPQSRTPRPYNGEPGRTGTPGSYGMQPPVPRYGTPARMQSPGPQGPYDYRRGSPGPAAGGYGQRTQTPNSYGRQYPGAPRRQYSASSQSQYSAAPSNQYAGDMHHDPYSGQQQYPGESYQQQSSYSPAPRRQYTGDSQAQYTSAELPAHTADASQSMSYSNGQQNYPAATSPIQNNSGFDFSSDASRPGVSPPPGQTANGGTAYPGYRTYKPA